MVPTSLRANALIGAAVAATAAFLLLQVRRRRPATIAGSHNIFLIRTAEEADRVLKNWHRSFAASSCSPQERAIGIDVEWVRGSQTVLAFRGSYSPGDMIKEDYL